MITGPPPLVCTFTVRVCDPVGVPGCEFEELPPPPQAESHSIDSVSIIVNPTQPRLRCVRFPFPAQNIPPSGRNNPKAGTNIPNGILCPFWAAVVVIVSIVVCAPFRVRLG